MFCPPAGAKYPFYSIMRKSTMKSNLHHIELLSLIVLLNFKGRNFRDFLMNQQKLRPKKELIWQHSRRLIHVKVFNSWNAKLSLSEKKYFSPKAPNYNMGSLSNNVPSYNKRFFQYLQINFLSIYPLNQWLSKWLQINFGDDLYFLDRVFQIFF